MLPSRLVCVFFCKYKRSYQEKTFFSFNFQHFQHTCDKRNQWHEEAIWRHDMIKNYVNHHNFQNFWVSQILITFWGGTAVETTHTCCSCSSWQQHSSKTSQDIRKQNNKVRQKHTHSFSHTRRNIEVCQEWVNLPQPSQICFLVATTTGFTAPIIRQSGLISKFLGLKTSLTSKNEIFAEEDMSWTQMIAGGLGVCHTPKKMEKSGMQKHARANPLAPCNHLKKFKFGLKEV